MKKHWWKALGVVLVTYTIIMGFVIPMKPALVDDAARAVETAKTGQNLSIKALGYNTFFSKSPNIKAWLTITDSTRDEKGLPNVFAIASEKVEIADDRNLTASFVIPQFLPLSNPVQDANLVLETQEEGLLVRRSALQIAQDSVDMATGKSLWNASINVEAKSKKMTYPNLQLTRESIRNTFFHVPMWFVMFTLFAVGLYHSLQYLRKGNAMSDTIAASYTQTGVLFGLLGLFTGATWANYTWGQPFPIEEIKLLMTYTALAIYMAYFILRASFEDFEKRARISAVYSIFAFSSLIPLLYVIPKLAQQSNHPGNGGNNTIGAQDLDNTLRMVFYPSVIGWILIGLWVGNLTYRYYVLKEKVLSN